MPEPVYFVNNQFVPASKAQLHISDLAIMRGYGVFDFLITYNHRPFRLDDHLKRLKNSLKLIDLEPPKSLSQIKTLVLKTLEKNHSQEEKAVRIIVTGGESLAPDFVKAKNKAGLVITVDPKHDYPPECYTHGVKVITVDDCRPIPGAKTLNYVTAIKAQKQAKAGGAIEAIYVCGDHVMEGTTSNFFAVIGDQIVTTNQGILLGITRKVILELAEKIAPIEKRPIHKDEISLFEEAFITASNKEVMPVAQIDQQRIGKGKIIKPGPITQKIMTAFRKYTQTSRS